MRVTPQTADCESKMKYKVEVSKIERENKAKRALFDDHDALGFVKVRPPKVAEEL